MLPAKQKSHTYFNMHLSVSVLFYINNSIMYSICVKNIVCVYLQVWECFWSHYEYISVTQGNLYDFQILDYAKSENCK